MFLLSIPRAAADTWREYRIGRGPYFPYCRLIIVPPHTQPLPPSVTTLSLPLSIVFLSVRCEIIVYLTKFYFCVNVSLCEYFRPFRLFRKQSWQKCENYFRENFEKMHQRTFSFLP
jgi:hypothetical protein